MNTDRVRVFSVGPTKARGSRQPKVLSYLSMMFWIHTYGMNWLKGNRYDLCLFASIGILSGGLPRRLRASGAAHALMFILWDFFPVHHTEIGRIRSQWYSWPLKRLERWCMERSDIIAVMSPRNAEFLRQYHPGLMSRTVVLPPWSTSPTLSSPLEKFPDFTAVFGGQLVAGRGVQTLLEAARLLQARDVPCKVLIVGEGPDRNRLHFHAQKTGLEHVQFLDLLPREEYHQLLCKAHVGVAVTVSGVSVPTFPSKIVDYLGLALPVVTCLEEATDAGQMVADRGAGINVRDLGAQGLADALEQLYSEYMVDGLAQRSRTARKLWEDEFSVCQAARTVQSVI